MSKVHKVSEEHQANKENVVFLEVLGQSVLLATVNSVMPLNSKRTEDRRKRDEKNVMIFDFSTA